MPIHISNKIIESSTDLCLIIVENVKHLDEEYPVHKRVEGNGKGVCWWVFDTESSGI
jgi:hypothetical protein